MKLDKIFISKMVANIEEMALDNLPIDAKNKVILSRRINKLKRDPKDFFESSMKKHRKQIKKYLPIKYNGSYQYTVVSAVYNVEKYLDDYFKSLVNQSLNFKKHIRLILVDDGSTDNSAQIIKKWQKKYPNNIEYYYKKNGGQASARNLGLQYVQTEWVTFIDADDFLDINYFYLIDKEISKNQDIVMVCCNQIYYFEESDQYIDRHPLGYRFKHGIVTANCDDLKKNIHFSAALSVIKVSSIPFGLIFDERLKPTFEDGKFINTFLLKQNKNSLVCYHPEAQYFNRKREDKSSTMDGVWQHKGQFTSVFKYGYLDILSKCKQELGFIPIHLQRTILWEMLKLVKQLLNHEERVDFLTQDEKKTFLENIDRVFEYIDKDIIMNYELGNCGFSRQLGMLGCFKKLDVDRQVAYIDQVDSKRNLFSLRFFTSIDSSFRIIYKENEQEIIPKYYKKAHRNFLDRTFLIEHRLWIFIPKESKTIDLSINNRRAFINFDGKKYKTGINSTLFTNNKVLINQSDIWLFMDRDDSAGDNAEFFYEYVRNFYPKQEIYFVISNRTKDWSRLKAKNFNLIDHGSQSHKILLEKCNKLISSQVGLIVEPFSGLSSNYQRIFLQHGVTKDDVSDWLNNVKIDLMLTSTKGEYHSIVNDGSTYVYGKKEISLSGFPRFDSLYKQKNSYKNQLLIMFTWRKSITGGFIKNGISERILNTNFNHTVYYKKINELLNSQKLKNIASEADLDIVFCAHPNMKPYLSFFNIPNYIRVADESMTIHDLINQSRILITDFSSVAFDFAYQEKPIAYYQFDKDEFFQGNHTYIEGYFSYEKNGFGKISYTESELCEDLHNIVQRGLDSRYHNRIKSTFAHQDDKNCERVYQAIRNMDKPDDEIDIDILKELINSDYKKKLWDSVVKRIKILLEFQDNNVEYQMMLVEALIEDGKIEEAQAIIKHNPSINFGKLILKLALSRRDWQTVLNIYPNIEPCFKYDYMYLQALICLGNIDDAKIFINQIDKYELREFESLAIRLWEMVAQSDFRGIIALGNKIESLNIEELQDVKAQLVLSKAYRMLGRYSEAQHQLDNFESHTRNDIDCRIEIAELAFMRKNYTKCINQFNKLRKVGVLLSDIQKYQYAYSLFQERQFRMFIKVIEDDIISQFPDLQILYVKALTQEKQWQEALDIANSYQLTLLDELTYEIVLTQYRLGMIEEAFKRLTKPKFSDSYPYWQLVAEISFLMGDKELAKYCYRNMIAKYPFENKVENMQILSQLNEAS